MTWVRLDDTAPQHPKFARSGVAAYGWWTAALCYCSRYLTDGFIASKDLPHVFRGLDGPELDAVVDTLIANRSVKKVRGGIKIHDYLSFQPSRAEVEKLRKDKVSAGRLGGLRSWESRTSAQAPARPRAQAPGLAPAKASAEATSHDIHTSHDLPKNKNLDAFPHGNGSNGTRSVAEELAEHTARQEAQRKLLRTLPGGLPPETER